MFDVGFAELFLLFIIGLLVLGPERLPAVARTIGGFVRKARMSYYNLKRTVEAELAAAEAANPVNEARRELESVQKQVKELSASLDETIDGASAKPSKEQADPAATEAAGADTPTEDETVEDSADDRARDAS